MFSGVGGRLFRRQHGGRALRIPLAHYHTGDQQRGAGLRASAPNFLFLGLVCTAAIIALQTWGQSHSTANEAAVIYSFEPAAAAFFAFFWLAESMTARGWLGGALLIASMIVSQWNAAPRPAAALAPE